MIAQNWYQQTTNDEYNKCNTLFCKQWSIINKSGKTYIEFMSEHNPFFEKQKITNKADYDNYIDNYHNYIKFMFKSRLTDDEALYVRDNFPVVKGKYVYRHEFKYVMCLEKSDFSVYKKKCRSKYGNVYTFMIDDLCVVLCDKEGLDFDEKKMIECLGKLIVV